MIRSVIGLVIGFTILSVVFGLLERWSPATVPAPLRSKRALRTDLLYWMFTPLVTKAMTSAAIVVIVAIVFAAMGSRLDRESLRGFGPLARQPAWLQVAEMLVLGDFIGYWLHRRFHRGRLWPFHAVHHSSTVVDWLSSVRLHPVNDAAMKLFQALPLLALGFAPGTLKTYAPLLTFYAIFVHASVNWDFGPLRYVVASRLLKK